MAQDHDYIRSIQLWIEEQITLIEAIKANKEYLIKDIEIKKRTLSIIEESIIHEEQSLKKGIEKLKT